MSSEGLSGDDSLATLVADLDDSFWNAPPTPDASPLKPNPKTFCLTSTPIKPHRALHESPLKFLLSPSKVLGLTEDGDISQTLDGIDTWDWDDTFSEPPSSPKKTKRELQQRSKSIEWTRCTVRMVEHGSSNGRYQIVLTALAEQDGSPRTVILRDDWVHTDINTGDTIHVIGSFTHNGASPSIEITSKDNLVIHHPDLLVTITAVSTAWQCRRKPLLSGLVRSSTDYTPALVWGNMLHEVMQTCLSENKWEAAYIDEQIGLVISRGLMDLVRIDTSVHEAWRELHERSKGLQAFAAKYLSQVPKPEAVLTNTRDTAVDAPSLLAISDVLDIEEDIWSPTYGLRGKLDVTVFAHTGTANTTQPSIRAKVEILKSNPTPFEIKTGKANAGTEHRAQTMLYTLLTEERYGSDVPAGLLYYTQSEEVVHVPRSRNEIRALIATRNELASWMMKRMGVGANQDSQDTQRTVVVDEAFLPPTIDNARQCKRCFVLDTCMLYRKAVENVVDTTSSIADTYQLKTSHLTHSHCDFFKKWEALLSYEERDVIRWFKKELWSLRAEEREKRGRCLANMVLDTDYDPSNESNVLSQAPAGIHRKTYRFKRSWTQYGSLLNGHINVGDPITISIEPRLLALARGFVLKLTATDIVVGVDHDLSLDSVKAKLAHAGDDDPKHIIFRIDKDEMSSGMGRIRNNIAQLFYADDEGGRSKRLRELVVDLEAPSFYDDLVPHKTNYQTISGGLNPTQMHALRRILSAQDYALVLGMPGTGKTTVIAALICALVQLGKTVLLASYTHSAVDTILLKLELMTSMSGDTKKGMCDFGVLRLGNVDKVHPQLRKYTLAARTKAQTIEQLKGQLMTPPVVATTCLSIEHYVRNPVARERGLDVSLFRSLSEAHPEAVVELSHQYRMNEDIMLLSNKLIYGDHLKCGNRKIAKQSLNIPDWSFINSLHRAPEQQGEDGACWLRRLLMPRTKAVFVDTDLVPARDSRVGGLVQNPVEAELVYYTVESLLRSGVKEDQIGIISLYRQQIKLISHLLEHRTGIEFLTADRSQGRDKDCIIISMVRSNDAGQAGDLVKDWRRMNVSFTRARRKLIIFGSRTTLQPVQLLDDFFQLMKSKGWIMQLPPGSNNVHQHSFGKAGEESMGMDQDPVDTSRPTKRKAKTVGGSVAIPLNNRSLAGILKGRPILQDLVNEEA
ncbi:Dna2 domain containing protein [Amanita muscaria]